MRVPAIAFRALGPAVALLVFAPAPGTAQGATDTERVTIVGRVLDQLTRRAIAGAAVDLPELGVRVLTDDEGQFEIKGLPLGVYDMALSATGYRNATGNFAVMRNGRFETTMMPLDTSRAVPPGRLVGRVSDGRSGRPVAGARVRVARVYLDGATGNGGRFAFSSVPPGRYAVEFSSLGYATRVDTVDVVSGLTSDARVSLAVDPVAMEPIVVSVERREVQLELNGFYERRELGQGSFIDLEFIERRAPQGMTDLFSSLPGAELRLGDAMNPMSRAIVLRGGRRDMTSGGQPCFPSVWIDGLIVHRAGAEPAYMNELISPTEVAGIEVYQSTAEVPIQFGGVDASCGVVVIWTR